MEQFGVYSEVGKLRKVIVHRPELSLKRLTPTNHDDLLFDDVLWVERAQWEHDQFVAAMRARGIQVFLLGYTVYSGYDYIGYKQVRFLNITRGVAEVIQEKLLPA